MHIDRRKSRMYMYECILEGWLQGLCLGTRISAHLVFPGKEVMPASFIAAFVMVPCVV